MPRGFTEQERENIRNRLIETGMESFGLYGIKKTSVEDLALKSGISKGAFYQFYSSKEDLYFDIIRHLETEIHSNMYKVLNNSDKDEKAVLKTVMLDVTAQVDNVPFFKRLLGKDEFNYLWQKFTPEQIEKSMDVDIEFTSSLLESWREKGKLRTDDPVFVTGLFRAFFVMLLHKEDIGEDVFPQVLEFYLNSIIDKIIE